MRTLEQKLQDFIVVTFLNKDEDLFYITHRDKFENTNLCDCYDNYGQHVGCENSGCYSLDNSESSFASDCFSDFINFTSTLTEEQNEAINAYIANEDLSKKEFIEACIEEDCEFASQFKKQIDAWIESNTHHTKVKAWTYWNGNNHKSLVISADDDSMCDVKEADEETSKAILENFEGALDVFSGASASKTIGEYTYTTTRYSNDPWLAVVEPA